VPRHRAPLPALILFAGITTAAADEKESSLYYPTTVGARIVYRSADGSDDVRSVSKVERKGRDVVVHETRVIDGEDVPIGATGLLRTSSGGRDLDPPLRLLKLPAKPGETWEWTNPADRGKYAMKTRGQEEVTVPAGKYKAVVVEQEHTRGGQPVRTVYWFAPGVGLVKAVTKLDDGERVDLELKSFSRVAD
jgi:hypothetical protein